MREHLEFLFGRALSGKVEITAIHTDKEAGHKPRTRFFAVDELDEAAEHAARVNKEQGWNAYVGAALRNDDVFPGQAADDGDFWRAYAVWADADDGEHLDHARDKYRELGLTPPMIVVTGRTPSKRAQMWWPLDNPIEDIDALRGLLRGIAGVLGTDPKVCTGKQLMRLGGSVSWPKKEDRILERTEVVRVDRAAREFSYEQLARAFPPQERASGGGVTIDVQIEHGGALGLEERIMDGREGYAFRLIRAHLREFIGTTGSEPDADELYREVAPIYLAKTDQVRPGRGPAFLKEKVSEALRAYHAGQIPGMRDLEEAVLTWAQRHETGPFEDEEGESRDDGESATSADDLAPEGYEGVIPPPRPWAYGNILMYQAVTGIAAPPGVGKTTFSFQIGLAFCLSMPFGPWTPAIGGGGKVWLYNGEEPKDELNRRYLAACAEMGVEPHVAAQRMFYNSGLRRPLRFLHLDPKSGDLIRSPDVDAIKARIVQADIKLFVVDPLIEFHGAKEDTEGFHAIGAVLREIAHECDCAVLFFHHTPKAATSDSAAGDMNAMRGGGPIVGVARFVATMFNMSAKDAETCGVEPHERVKYVRFDDAKANMALMSGEPQWWVKLGVSIENAAGLRPADNIGVLRFQRFASASDRAAEHEAAGRQQRRTTTERIAREIARVCAANGHTSEETASSFDAIMRALDPIRTGVSVNTAKTIAASELGDGCEIDGGRLVISTVPRGKLTVRKVHIEREAGDGK